jgi:DNA-binding winged helix-turn-helix (wHTH) protein
MKAEGIIQFGEFQVDALARTLRQGEEIVTLNRRAFDVLLYLVQNPGRLLTRDELLKNVWPDTFVDENSLAQSISALRRALEEKPGDNSYIVTLPGRGYQFVSPVKVLASESLSASPDAEAEAPLTNPSQHILLHRQMIRTSVFTEEAKEAQLSLPASRRRSGLVLMSVALVLALAIGAYSYFPRAKLTDKDTVVLADFGNTTGDQVFDGTLRQALFLELQQSTFLNLLSDRRIGQTLVLMTQPKDSRLTHDVAREVCLRTGSTAVLDGSIAQVGTRYLVALRATNCANGELLAGAEAQANDKDHVLDALGKVATAIRPKLGESLASTEKYDVPVQYVTTPSLEALQAYSLGIKAGLKGDAGAMLLYQRAVTRDPNFAMAYLQLGVGNFNGGATTLAKENLQKAYELRERVSEREKFFISAHQADIGDGDFEAARKVYELWAQIYPRDPVPPNSLGVVYDYLGNRDKQLAADQAALKLDPSSSTNLSNLVNTLIDLNRLDEAKAVARQAYAVHPDLANIHSSFYMIDFLQHDAAGMEQEAAWMINKGGAGWPEGALFNEADTAAYGGHFVEARELTRRAIDSAEHNDRKEAAAEFEEEAAVREAMAGNLSLAKQQAMEGLTLARDTEIDGMAAIALALADDPAQSALLADSLDKAYPHGTIVQFNFLPTIRAATVLRHDPRKAIAALTVSTPYELGATAPIVLFCLYPVYLRGEAYLEAKQGNAAAAEFQKVLDHSGVIGNEVIGALAHLGLGRAYALAGDTTKAKANYDDFLKLWKGADPDIPVYKHARIEYAKLQ